MSTGCGLCKQQQVDPNQHKHQNVVNGQSFLFYHRIIQLIRVKLAREETDRTMPSSLSFWRTAPAPTWLASTCNKKGCLKQGTAEEHNKDLTLSKASAQLDEQTNFALAFKRLVSGATTLEKIRQKER